MIKVEQSMRRKTVYGGEEKRTFEALLQMLWLRSTALDTVGAQGGVQRAADESSSDASECQSGSIKSPSSTCPPLLPRFSWERHIWARNSADEAWSGFLSFLTFINLGNRRLSPLSLPMSSRAAIETGLNVILSGSVNRDTIKQKYVLTRRHEFPRPLKV